MHTVIAARPLQCHWCIHKTNFPSRVFIMYFGKPKLISKVRRVVRQVISVILTPAQNTHTKCDGTIWQHWIIELLLNCLEMCANWKHERFAMDTRSWFVHMLRHTNIGCLWTADDHVNVKLKNDFNYIASTRENDKIHLLVRRSWRHDHGHERNKTFPPSQAPAARVDFLFCSFCGDPSFRTSDVRPNWNGQFL